MNRQFQRSFTRLAPPALVLIALAAAFSSAQNQSTVANEPASEGRPITPAGSLILDTTTGHPAVGSLPVAFVRSPDHAAKDGGGRYLIIVNSGYGIQFNAATNPEQQSISVLDLNAQPSPQVIQNVYFPSPQSAQVGAAFSPEPDSTGAYTLYVSGGFENKIWMFRFRPNAPQPVSPASNGPDTKVTAPFISVSGFATEASSPRYNDNEEPVYPLGIALSADGDSLFLANDLGDNLGIIRDLRFKRRLIRVDLSDGHAGHFVYPYGVAAWTPPGSRETQKVFVSGWATASVAAVDVVHPEQPVTFIPVGRHPTAMLFNAARTRLYVANSDDDSVSVIDHFPRSRRRNSLGALVGEIASRRFTRRLGPQRRWRHALRRQRSQQRRGCGRLWGLRPWEPQRAKRRRNPSGDDDEKSPQRSQVRGFIPTGQYPSAIAVADGSLFVANGKGTGFESSSVIANDSGRAPNTANDRFPAGTGRTHQGGEYDVALIAGTISQIAEPDARTLVDYTNQVMRNDGLIGAADVHLFGGASPIHHVIYIIRENRTYDQVFGDVGKSGDGQPADGDSALAIFGDGSGARRARWTATEDHSQRARPGPAFRSPRPLLREFRGQPRRPQLDRRRFLLRLRGQSLSAGIIRTAATPMISREPIASPRSGRARGLPPILPVPATPDDLAHLIQRYVPYLNGSRDVAEPATLYLWDAAARAGLTYRTDGECVVTISQAEMDAFNANREREYPDVTPTVVAFPLKKSLEGHSSPTHRDVRSLYARFHDHGFLPRRGGIPFSKTSP